MRAFPVLVVVLLVSSAAGHAVAVDTADRRTVADTAALPGPNPSLAVTPSASVNSTNASEAPNVSRILSLPRPAVDASNITLVRIDAGGATETRMEVGALRMKNLYIRERLNRTDTPSERAAVVREEVRALENRSDELREEQQEAIRAYNSNEIGTRTFLLRLARIDRVAELLGERTRLLISAATGTFDGESSVFDDLSQVRYDLRSFDGPVRERIAAAVEGETTETRVYVATTSKGVALTTIVNDTYVREVYRGFLWEQGGEGISGSDVSNVTARSYPEIWEARNRTSGVGSNSTFIFSVRHAGGALEAHIRGDNRRVFKEVQRIPLERFPLRPATKKQLGGLTLLVNRTYAGGPLRIKVIDTKTQNPLNVSVSLSRIGGLGSTPIGSTGEDGVIWTLAPGGQTSGYAITAVDEGPDIRRIIQLVTAPTDPVTVDDALGLRVEPPSERSVVGASAAETAAAEADDSTAETSSDRTDLRLLAGERTRIR
jgi:hypothetical protein